MLGRHPELADLPCSQLFAAPTIDDLFKARSGATHFLDGLIRAIAHYGLGGQEDDNVAAAEVWLHESRHRAAVDVFRDLAQWTAPRRLVDVIPCHDGVLPALQRALRAFPDARFLHLVRHPRAVCEFPRRRPAEAPAAETVWLRPHLQILEFLETVSPERQRRLLGERLLNNPTVYLAQIAQWLSIQGDDTSLGAMLHPEASPFARRGPDNAPDGYNDNFVASPGLRHVCRYPDSLDQPLSAELSGAFDETVRGYATHFGY